MSRPGVPLLLVKPQPKGVADFAPAVAPDTGDWVLAVALRDDGSPVFAYGLYESSVKSKCGKFGYTKLRASIPLTGAFLGGGLFSLRGALAGIVALCDDELAVLSIDSVAAAVSTPLDVNDVLEEKYGLRVTPEEKGGLQVAAVWSQGPGENAGMRPGDRMTTVDDKAVASVAELLAALGTDE